MKQLTFKALVRKAITRRGVAKARRDALSSAARHVAYMHTAMAAQGVKTGSRSPEEGAPAETAAIQCFRRACAELLPLSMQTFVSTQLAAGHDMPELAHR